MGKALKGEERPHLGLVRDHWEYAATEMRRGYFWITYGQRVIAIHPESGWGQTERNRLGLNDREALALFGGAR